MSIVQAPVRQERISPVPTRHPWWRLTLLCILLLTSIGFNIYLRLTAPPADSPATSFIAVWLLSFLPYVAACILVLITKPQVGWRRWIELGLILVGALILRAIVLPVLPNLSHDSWRYLWDARVTLLGYSPYVYGPGDPH